MSKWHLGVALSTLYASHMHTRLFLMVPDGFLASEPWKTDFGTQNPISPMISNRIPIMGLNWIFSKFWDFPTLSDFVFMVPAVPERLWDHQTPRNNYFKGSFRQIFEFLPVDHSASPKNRQGVAKIPPGPPRSRSFRSMDFGDFSTLSDFVFMLPVVLGHRKS